MPGKEGLSNNGVRQVTARSLGEGPAVDGQAVPGRRAARRAAQGPGASRQRISRANKIGGDCKL